MSKKILLLTGDFTEDYEVIVPFQALQILGYNVDAVCPEKEPGDTIKTAIHDFEGDQTYTEKAGHNFYITANFEDVNINEYEGLFITGGRSPEYLRLNPKVIEIVQEFMKTNKPIAAICHAPQILTVAGVLKGRRATAYPAIGPEIMLAGGIYLQVAADEAIVDGNLVTAPTWAGNISIIKAFVKLLGAKIQI